MTQPSSSLGLWEWVERHKVISTVVGMAAAMVLIGTVSEDPVDAAAEAPPAKVTQRDDQRGDERRGERRVPLRSDAAGKAKLERPSEIIGVAQRPATTYVVSHVVDGESLELGNGEQVRLVGVDAPEQGACGYERARATLADLVEGERVTLGASDRNRDEDGRLLRYVDIASVDAGLQLIEDGVASARHDAGDASGFHPREAQYVIADLAAADLFCGSL